MNVFEPMHAWCKKLETAKPIHSQPNIHIIIAVILVSLIWVSFK